MGFLAENPILIDEMQFKENSPLLRTPVFDRRTRQPLETKITSVSEYVQRNLCEKFVF